MEYPGPICQYVKTGECSETECFNVKNAYILNVADKSEPIDLFYGLRCPFGGKFGEIPSILDVSSTSICKIMQE